MVNELFIKSPVIAPILELFSTRITPPDIYSFVEITVLPIKSPVTEPITEPSKLRIIPPAIHVSANKLLFIKSPTTEPIVELLLRTIPASI